MKIDEHSPEIKLLCLGPSQWPLLRNGSEIAVDPTSIDALKTGDLVVYDKQGTRVCHRVIFGRGAGSTAQWLIKGDANFKADGWIHHHQIIGRVTRVGQTSVKHPLFSIPSRALFWHSRLQYLTYEAIFNSPVGRRIGFWKYRFYRPPVFSNLFAKVTTPWLQLKIYWDSKSKSREWFQAKVRNILRPPETVGLRLRPHKLDYGHALFYEEIFCQGDGAIENLISLCRHSRSGVLDLGGGAGRLSMALAGAGIPTVLVDNSKSMLKVANQRHRKLPPGAQGKLEIYLQDIRCLELNRDFDKLISLNNGLEHVGTEDDILQTLKRLRAHASPSAEAFIDVHNLPFWEKHRALWKKGEWTHLQTFPFRKQPVRYLWERTSPGSDPAVVVWEHAFSTFCMRYRLSKTSIRIFERKAWISWFERSGWSVVETWGTWAGAPSLTEYPKIIFRLGAV